MTSEWPTALQPGSGAAVVQSAPSTTEELARKMAPVGKEFICELPRIDPADRVPEGGGAEAAGAGVLMRRLAEAIASWRNQLPEQVQPAVMAILHGGAQIDVDCLAQEGFNGVRVMGRIGGNPCLVLAHQSTLQLLCYVQPVAPPAQPRRTIGFVIDGEETQA